MSTRTTQREYLPRLYSNDVSLKELNLRNTSCNDVALVALTDSIKGNHVLRVLHLESNGIGDSGAQLLAEVLSKNLDLQEMYLDDNLVGEVGGAKLCQAMETNNTLQIMTYRDNPIPMEVTSLLDTLVTLNRNPPPLKKAVLALRRNEAGDTINISRVGEVDDRRQFVHDPRVHLDDWCATVLANLLAQNCTVTLVDLSYHHIGNGGAAALAAMLHTNRNIDRLILVGNLVATEGALCFVDALDGNNCLRYVNLHGNPVTDETVMEVEKACVLNRQPLTLKKAIKALRENDPSTVHVELDDHMCERYYDDISARLLTESLLRNTSLMSLAITNSHVTRVGARFLSDMLATNSTLLALDLSHNPLQEGSSALAETLKQINRTLQSLRLVDVGMPDESGAVFADMLQDNTTLTELDLSENPKLGPCGTAFARSFFINTTLKVLLLEGTTVSDKAKIAIAERMEIAQEPQRLRDALPGLYSGDESLRVLDLHGDGNSAELQPLRDSSAKLLAVPLKDNYIVCEINLSHNLITYDGAASLCAALLDNRVTTQRLDLSYNPIHDKGYEFGRLIGGLIKSHSTLTSINIAHTGLDTVGCEQILKAVGISKPNIVQHLDISGNADVEKDVAFRVGAFVRCNALLPAFKEVLCNVVSSLDECLRRGVKLEAVDFGNYAAAAAEGYPPNVHDEAAALLCDVVRHTKGAGIQKICFAGTKIGDAGAQAFADLLSCDEGKSIVSLDLRRNLIGDAGLRALQGAVRKSYSIASVMLEGNPVSPAELEELNMLLLYNTQKPVLKDLLVGVAAPNSTVTAIDVSDFITDHFTDERVRLLCRAMANNTSVTSVDVSNNHIHTEGLVMLAEMVEAHPSITRLRAKNTLIRGEQVGKILSKLLSSGHPITFLDLSFNELCDAVVPPIVQAVETNRTIKHIGLHECGISEPLERRVREMVSLNTASRLKDLVSSICCTHNQLGGSYATEIVERDGISDANAGEILRAVEQSTTIALVDLSDNELSDDSGVGIMDSLSKNRSVKTLKLANNKFSSATLLGLISLLHTNATLEDVDLSNNCMNDASQFPQLADVLAYNDTLYRLDLSGNRALSSWETDHPKETFLADLTLNRQHAIKKYLQELKNDNGSAVTTLDASKDPYHDDTGACLVARALSDASCALTALDLSCGILSDMGAKSVCGALRINRTLKQLSLAGNNLTDVAVDAVAGMLQVNSVLRMLDLSNLPRVTSRGCENLSRALEQNHSVERLVIKGWNGVPRSLLQRVEFLMELNTRNLNLKHMLLREEELIFTELDLSNSAAQGKVLDTRGCEIVCHLLMRNQFVTKLNMSRNQLTFESAYSIAKMLLSNTRLTELNLSYNNILDGSMTIVDAMYKNRQIIKLDLNECGCSPLSLEKLNLMVALNREPFSFKEAIIKLLEKDVTHTTVKIQHPQPVQEDNRKTRMDDDSVLLLTSLLRTDLIVRSVDLAWNAIQDRGTLSVADLLKSNSGLTSISLAHNHVTDVGMKGLCNVLWSTPSLSHVDMTDNSLTSECVDAVTNVLRHNPEVKHLLVDGNSLSSDAVSAVHFLCSVNTHAPASEIRTPLIAAFDNVSSQTTLNFQSAYSMGRWNKEMISIISRALQCNTHVVELNLEYNDIKDDDLVPLCSVLPLNKTLARLFLGRNLLVDVSSLCRALKCNSSLKSLDLRSNQMNIVSARALAHLLCSWDVLEELDVSHNTWGRTGLSVLIGALPLNDGLKSINVEAKDIGADMQEAASHAVTLHYKRVHLAPPQSPDKQPATDSDETRSASTATNPFSTPQCSDL